MEQTLRTCKNGHQYVKSSDCPTCPMCEEAKKPNDVFLALLSGPARRALENANIKTLEQLSEYAEKEVLKLHGMGKASMPVRKEALENIGLEFKG